MSLLAPLYFAGALAVALPILFHLIRQRPKTQRQFSSLMFLDETPPRLTRRSKLDQWPLLLLRSLALLLLAAAFARPFFRSVDVTDHPSPPKRIVLLIDTSASMQRSDLWTKSVAEAERVIADLADQDRLAIVSFDRKPTTWMRLDESASLSLDTRRQAARTILGDLKPTWNATDIAAALVVAAETASEDSFDDSFDDSFANSPDKTAGETTNRTTNRTTVHLISDMQSGGNTSQLQSFAWPAPVQVLVHRIVTESRTNAAAFLMADADFAGPASSADVRVRVVNAGDGRGDSFTLAWHDETKPLADAVPIQVPPGQTRVVRMNAPPSGTASLVLAGDDDDFDNTRFVAVNDPRSRTIGFFGDVADDQRLSLFYYLGQVPLDDRTQTVTVKPIGDAEIASLVNVTAMPLVVVATGLSTIACEAIKTYLESGGRVLFVLDDPGTSVAMTQAIGQVVGDDLRITEAVVDDYHMLSQIQFSDAMFESVADPQFNDFTKVRFWSHRSVDGLDGWNVTARFDDGDAAIAWKSIGAGQAMLLTAGWQPRSSQLALSTKFIPMVSGWLGAGDVRLAMTELDVGDPIPAENESLSPGRITIDDGIGERIVAVNVAASESETEPIGDEVLEQFGITVGQTTMTVDDAVTQRQLRDQELESRQNIWRWLLVVALVCLAIETWWADRASTIRPVPE